MDIDSLINQITDLEEAVRKHINTHCYQELLKDSSNWDQICSSLDVIGDTLYAIGSYEETEFPNDPGLKYIYTYGLLQSLFLQQDALRHLSEAFDINFKPSQVLLDIRGIRNASIGHPTKQNQKGKRYYNHISRISMSKKGFDMLRFSGAKAHDMINVDIYAMLQDQLSEVANGYKAIDEKLSGVDRMHKEKFNELRIQDIFPSAMGYFFEKIGQGISAHSSGDREFGQSNLKIVRKIYEKYVAALRERNELCEYTEFDLNEYHHALNRIKDYLSGENKDMEELDARIYLSFVRNRHLHFIQIAKEIDEQYKKRKS